MIKHYYNIAGFDICVELPESVDAGALLPSFTGFESLPGKEVVFMFTSVDVGVCHVDETEEFLEENNNDIGITLLKRRGDNFIVDIKYEEGGINHRMVADSDFSNITAYVDWSDFYISMVVSSMLRIAFSQAILKYSAISIHSSAVTLNNQGYLFLGKSGTGKSTHSSLWLDTFQGCELLNDDNPIIRLSSDNIPWVFGSPWSGKTDCYKNKGVKIGGIAGLIQNKENLFCQSAGIDAFIKKKIINTIIHTS